ncbi:hypothetical protein MJO55_23615 [Mycolicibacterium rufum]|uniref:Uncharacterized protein n=1 Tax=Mycolicibacterium rufum TaxID=318424 RepID=A0A9X3BE49_9MYCO|nr:hypothetical protein [Mycolicibacterium rufum]MCV7069443.1 hypothetical protein [Mycolicibacterium rufum]ULP36174.1 hypothetical protein MJO55_23615 [Mycolicibacterium rufum]
MQWWGWWGWQRTDPWWTIAIRLWFHKYPLKWWHDWHYTDGWGSFGTILVAALAILASIWYNRRTLFQAQVIGAATIAITKQQRDDLRYDVLRKELAQWLTMVSEVERLCGELLRRLQESDSYTRSGPSPHAHYVDVGGPSIGALHSIVGQTISEPFTNLTTQGIQIQMLTADYSILVNLHFITQAIIGKVQLLYGLAANATVNQNSDDTFAIFMIIAQDYQFTRQIRWAQADLMKHVIQRFNPKAVGALQRVWREHPDVIGFNQPLSVWRPSDGWPMSNQSTAENTESDNGFADDDTEPLTVPILGDDTNR